MYMSSYYRAVQQPLYLSARYSRTVSSLLCMLCHTQVTPNQRQGAPSSNEMQECWVMTSRCSTFHLRAVYQR
jgi:hypothetical protein